MLLSEPFGGILPGARGAVLATLLRTSTPLTGRQVYALVRDHYSLWSVQEALKAWTRLGIVQTQTFGRATVHTIKESHAAVAPLRALLDPIASLTETVVDVVGDSVQAVILFGSVARGEASEGSDIDLAVIAPASWDGRADLMDAIGDRLGNRSEVLVFTEAEFRRQAAAGEPVVADIVRDGVALMGSKPGTRRGVA